MGAPKNQISPIPPESYGERFKKFIAGLTMTKEDQEREVRSSEQVDGSTSMSNTTNQRSSFNLSRKSTDRVIENAEKQARKSEERGAVEDERRDRTLSAKRSPSAERANGVTTILPVVEEDREASSREESLMNERRPSSTGRADEHMVATTASTLHRPEGKREKSVHGGEAAAILDSPIEVVPSAMDGVSEDVGEEVKSIRNRDGDKPPPTPEKDIKYQSAPRLSLALPPLPPLKFEGTPRVASPATFDVGEALNA